MGIILVVFILFSSGANAVLQCGESVSGVTVLKLSGQSNAHGELFSQATYPISIKCADTGAGAVTLNNGTSNPQNVVRLSGVTNAHAEAPNQPTTYTQNVQLGFNGGSGDLRIEVVNAPSTCSSLDGGGYTFTEVVRLSNTLNAHLQSPAFVGAPYPIRICAAYNPTGTPLPTDDIVSVGMSSIPINIPDTGTTDVIITSQNLITPSNPNFSNYAGIGTVRATFMCDLEDPECQNIGDFTTAATEILLPGFPFVPNSIEGNNYGANSPAYLAAMVGLGISSTSTQDPLTSDQQTYTIDPAVLTSGHTYRLFTILFPAEYTYTSVFDFEDNSKLTNNFDSLDFTVGTAGPCPGTGCPCPGPTCPDSGAGGDVYVIKSLTVDPTPSIKGHALSANVTIENKRADLPGTISNTLQVIIRDEQGNIIPGFEAGIPVTFNNTSVGNSITQAVNFLIDPGTNTFFEAGKTYTLYVSVPKYTEGVTSPNNEIITANNSSSNAFVLIEEQAPISVPDAPWWMSVMMVAGILGWLFISSRNTTQ